MTQKLLKPYSTFQANPFPRRRGVLEKVFDLAGWNRFFLREGVREIYPLESSTLVSPCDSKLVEIQSLRPSQPIRGKERLGEHEYYSFEEIAHCAEMLLAFDGGMCFNFYLSPFNLHYVLHPAGGRVTKTDYHPHFCWPILFMKSGEVKNERLAVYMESPQGLPFVTILVGSFLVSGIECVAKEGDVCEAGDLLGGFRMGSTVMVLFPKDSVQPLVEAGTKLKLGQPFAVWK